MERIRNLSLYQKVILVILAVMFVCFTVAYPIVSSRVGFEYEDSILIPCENNGNTVYSGKIKGEQAIFTVSPEKTVTFQYGKRTYGPYTAKENPTAVPDGREFMTGIELYEGENIFFRGGVIRSGDSMFLYDESGSTPGVTITYSTYDGTVRYADGSIYDEMKPSASTILKLMDGPELTNQGKWIWWFYGVILTITTAISILFVDELFRWNLSFQIRNADRAEPSELEMAGRYITWTVLPILALIVYLLGLKLT